MLLFLLFGTGIVFAGLFIYSFFKHQNRLASVFALQSLLISLYTTAYGLEMISDTLDEARICLAVEYFSIAFIPFLWLQIAYRNYTNKNIEVRSGMILCMVPAIAVFMNLTNDLHHLFFQGYEIISTSPYFIFRTIKGVVYYAMAGYLLSIACVAMLLSFLSWRRRRYRMKSRQFWLFLGPLIPFVASVLHVFDIKLYRMDPIPFSFLAAGLCYSTVVLWYDFLEVKEMIRGHAFGQINEGIFVLDRKNRIIDYNVSASRTFPWLNQDSIGESILSFDDGKRIIRHSTPDFDVELFADASQKSYRFRISDLKEGDRIFARLFLFQDVTEEKMAIDRLNYTATYDALSDVYNRSKLMQELESAWSHLNRMGGGFSLLMLDIDRFKDINDRYGHIAGDIVIREVARICKSHIQSQGIVGRFGGEEFLVMLPGIQKKQAQEIAEQIRVRIESSSIDLLGEAARITVSIGVLPVSNKEDWKTVQEIINDVDKALYTAKHCGRNQVCLL